MSSKKRSPLTMPTQPSHGPDTTPSPDQPSDAERYRLLFDHMSHGFALHQIVLDDQKRPVDYIFLEANKVFTEMTGLEISEIRGRRATEVLPGIENEPADWIGRYGRVTMTGEETRFDLLGAGAKDFVQKPYVPQDTLKKIRNILDLD